jgi:hypothetical protein
MRSAPRWRRARSGWPGPRARCSTRRGSSSSSPPTLARARPPTTATASALRWCVADIWGGCPVRCSTASTCGPGCFRSPRSPPQATPRTPPPSGRGCWPPAARPPSGGAGWASAPMPRCRGRCSALASRCRGARSARSTPACERASSPHAELIAHYGSNGRWRTRRRSAPSVAGRPARPHCDRR